MSGRVSKGIIKKKKKGDSRSSVYFAVGPYLAPGDPVEKIRKKMSMAKLFSL